MSKGDAIIWLCLILSCLAAVICGAVALHRSFGAPPASDDQSEFETFWRGRR